MIAPTLTDFLLFGSKWCCTCKVELPACADFFTPDKTASRGGLKNQCRACRAAHSREVYRTDPAVRAAASVKNRQRYQRRKAAA